MRRVPFLLALMLGLAACKPTIIEDPEPEPPPPSDPAEDPLIEQEAVRVAVRDYTAALRQRDVAAAKLCVVTETFGMYEDLRIAALRSSRDALETWDLLSVLMILQIRATIPGAELEQVDGRGLFGMAVANGLVGEGAEGVSLDEVWIADDKTVAEIRLDGAAIVWLRKTDDDGEPHWRIDIPEMIRQLGPAIEASVREQVSADGKARTAYTLLQLSSETAVDFRVLDGPLDNPGSDAP